MKKEANVTTKTKDLADAREVLKHASVFDYFKATGEFTDARDDNELPTTLGGGGEVPKAR